MTTQVVSLMHCLSTVLYAAAFKLWSNWLLVILQITVSTMATSGSVVLELWKEVDIANRHWPRIPLLLPTLTLANAWWCVSIVYRMILFCMLSHSNCDLTKCTVCFGRWLFEQAAMEQKARTDDFGSGGKRTRRWRRPMCAWLSNKLQLTTTPDPEERMAWAAVDTKTITFFAEDTGTVVGVTFYSIENR